MRHAHLLFAFVLSAAAACSSTGSSGPVQDLGGEDAGSAARDASVGDARTDGSVGTTDGGGPSDGSAPADGGGADGTGPADGGAVDGAGATDAAEEPAGPSLCDPAAVWTGDSLVPSASTADPDFLGSITPDELSIAWTTLTNGAPVVHYADRASTADPFGTPQVVDATTFGPFALDRVALSPDGLELVLVKADRSSFVAITRSARPGTFSTDASTRFKAFQPLPDEPPPLPSYYAPLLSADGSWFLYAVYRGVDDYCVAQSPPNMMNGWKIGTPIANTELSSSGGLLRVPTGLAADDRTLFYWDEVSGTEKAAWRNDATSTFNQFVDLGPNRYEASPNAACDRLYVSETSADGGPVDGGGPLDVYVAHK